MSINALGTIIRIFGIFFSLLIFWYILVNISYILICVLFSIEFSFQISLLLFSFIIIYRMFYPKNVFI